MAHPAPFRQYPGQNSAPIPPPQDPYGPPRNLQSRQGGHPRDQYDPGYRDNRDYYDDRNYRNGPPPQQQYPPPSRGGGPPQPQMMRRGPPPRDDYYDRRGPPPQQNGYDPRGAPTHPQHSQGPRKQRPPIQALDLAGQQGLPRPRRPGGTDDYGALVSPRHDKRFNDDDRRGPPPQQISPSQRMPPSRNGPPQGEQMPTMQFNMGPPPRTKSAPPDDPRNFDRNGQPPMPRSRDAYDDSRRPPMQNGRGGPPPSRGGRPPMDNRPPQQFYDRQGPDGRRRSPPNQYPPYDRPPPLRANTFPQPNEQYDPRGGPPPPNRMYDRRPPSQDQYDDRGYPERRPNGNNQGNVDELLDDYLEELGSPEQRHVLPQQFDKRPDPRYDQPPQQPVDQPRRTPPQSPEDRYSPPDRRQLVAQVNGGPPPPGPGRLPRSQTAPAPGISDLNRAIAAVDLRNETPSSEATPRTRSPNKLHKSPPRINTTAGVQSQAVTTPNGTVHDPNALPVFPSRNSLSSNPPSSSGKDRQSSSRGSIQSDRRNSKPREPKPPKPPLTFALLEDYRREAKDNPSDPAIQLDLAKALLEASTLLAPEAGMGDPKRVAKARQDYIAEAYKITKKLASSGSTGVGKPPYPDAMFFLASCYGEGSMGLPTDQEKAFNLYFSAAKAGHTASCYRTAMSCEVGIGTKRDPQKAIQFYRKAASLGDVAAMYKLGIIMLRGLLGLPMNVREGVTWLKRAAENADEDNPQALHILAQLYENPDDSLNGAVIKDEAYALELYTKSAQFGCGPSQYKLGSCYEYGSLGCTVDPRKSIAWYSRAAEQGDPEGELALSGWYLTGADGILPQSDQEAYLWAQKAAEKGLAKAEFAVGYYIETGIGVPKDIQEAKKWYLRAAEQGQKRAMARLAELKRMPNGGGVGSGGGKRELQKHRGGGGGGKEDCSIM